MRITIVFFMGWVLAYAAEPKPVTIEQASLQQTEDGPPLPPGFIFLPGDFINFSFQIANYQVSKAGQIKIDHRIDVFDASGTPLVEPEAAVIATEVSREDKKWMPKVRRAILVPSFAASGVFRVRATVKDLLGGSEATQEITFEVRGHDVTPSETLTVQNFRFLRSEEDKDALPIPAYQPGDTLWARFDITGFKLGEKNRAEVAYGLTVLRSNGEAMFSQPEAAKESDETFYPKRYVPGILSLNLQRDLRRGEYTLMLSVQDKVGSQKYETRQSFHVE